MIFTYRATGLDRLTGKIQNITRKIDTDLWLETLKDESIYGTGTAVAVEKDIVPLLERGELEELRDCISRYYYMWRANGLGTAVFELAMFVWAGFKKGVYSADTWATVLGFSWQAGTQGMLAAVKLSTAQVVEMFNAAPKHILFNVIATDPDDESLLSTYEQLDDTILVFRGVSSGMAHHENAFSWSLDIEEARDFGLRNCHSKKEAPGIIKAIIKKEAILCMFNYEAEVVVNPLIPKIKIQKAFLTGKELKKFHETFDSKRYLTGAFPQSPVKRNILEI